MSITTLNPVAQKAGEVRLKLEEILSQQLGKFNNGTPAIHVWPPAAPGSHQALLVLVCSIEIPVRQYPRGAYQVASQYNLEVTLRQKDKSNKGVNDLANASDLIAAHYPRSTKISYVGEPNYYRKDDDRDLILIHRLTFDRSIQRCVTVPQSI